MNLDVKLIREISGKKNEPKWMLEKRLEAWKVFEEMPMPNFGPDLTNLNWQEIWFYKDRDKNLTRRWEDVPQNLKNTFASLGILKAEQKLLAGVGTQVDSQMIYQKLKEKWEKQGIVFEDMDRAVQKYPKLVRQYFMTKCVTINNNKFAALNGALWSGGNFVYVPKGKKISESLQGYFFLKSRQMGQFEHTLIVAEEGAEVTYIEGCSAPRFSEASLHSGCVEIFVGKKARVTYMTVQNWSKNVYNFNTKRAMVDAEGLIEWISGSFGSKASMVYPTSVLVGKKARSNHLVISVAGKGQELDTGAKVIHQARDTKANIVAKSIAKNGGKTVFRGGAKVEKGARGVQVAINCENLLVGKNSIAKTFPAMEIEEEDTQAYHEAKTGKIAEEQLFYLMSRGLTEKQAMGLVINGFLEPVVGKFPLEYAIEINRLVNMKMGEVKD